MSDATNLAAPRYELMDMAAPQTTLDGAPFELPARRVAVISLVMIAATVAALLLA